MLMSWFRKNSKHVYTPHLPSPAIWMGHFSINQKFILLPTGWLPLPPTKVLVLGHSFISRFQLYACQQGRPKLDLDPAEFQVHYRGRPGICIAQLSYEHVFRTVNSISPQTVVIDIGTNDMDQGEFAVNLLASHLFLFARKLVCIYGVQHVIFLEVLHRGMGRYAPMHPRVDQFNLKVKT